MIYTEDCESEVTKIFTQVQKLSTSRYFLNPSVLDPDLDSHGWENALVLI